MQGEKLNAGWAIQIKFGRGWIAGRYEWSFFQGSPIQIHAEDEVIYIREGQFVWIRA